jgi:hypothetical protein
MPQGERPISHHIQLSGASQPEATPVPATLATAETMGGNWRAGFGWPAAPSGVFDLLHQSFRNYVDAVLSLTDSDTQAVALLARRYMPHLALVQASYFLDREQSSGFRLIGPPEFDELRGLHGGEAFEPSIDELELPQQAIRVRPFRRLARAASWSTWWTVPKALLWPDVHGLSHNSLMRAYIPTSKDAVRPIYIDEVIGTERPARLKVDPVALGECLGERMAELDDLSEGAIARLRPLLSKVMVGAVREGLDVLSRIRAARRLPQRLFTGTGADMIGRALGLEVIRRGGSATRFDHGGTATLMDSAEFLAQHEIAVSTRFIMPTPAATETSVVRRAAAYVSPICRTEIFGHTGDPGLDPGSASWRSTGPAKRRRVMYVGTTYHGFHQQFPPVVPAPLYLDWQIRLIGMLNRMPIDLVCKPHPEGVMRGKEPPLAAFARVTTERFEAVVNEADLLIYDYPATTTLSVGLSTDRPIVLIDHGTMRFNETVTPLIERRCRIVRGGCDERGRLTVSQDELAHAVCEGADVADPSEFRQLFLGEG